MPHKRFLLSSLPPTRRQERLAQVVLIALVLACLWTLPFRNRQLPAVDAFIPVVDTVLVLTNLTTAVLLFAQFSVVRRTGLLALASGYFFTACINVPHVLMFPGAFTSTGLLGAGLQSSAWLYTFCHFGLPPCAIAYALLKDRPASAATLGGSARKSIALSIGAVVAVSLALMWLVTAGVEWLPTMMADSVHATITWNVTLAPPIVILSFIPVVIMWRRRSSMLDLWILVVLWAWFIEALLLSATASRFSLVWYVGRTLGLVSSCFVLLVLLSESTMLYARMALSMAAEEREREGRRLTMDVMVASIAHELQQPLASIAANSSAGVQLLAGPAMNPDEARVALQEIDRDARRASRIVQSIRTTFASAPRNQTALDINELVRETLEMLKLEMRTHCIALQLEPSPDLPPAVGDRGQLQQVLLNVMTNAVESMATTKDRPRTLRIQSAPDGPDGLSILVEDSGIGIEAGIADRIFDPFFTTKSRGMGLGLALCRSIVEAHGGRLSVAPGRPHGSVFRVDLPTTIPDVESKRTSLRT